MIAFFSDEIYNENHLLLDSMMYLHMVLCWLLDYCIFHWLIILSIWIYLPQLLVMHVLLYLVID